MEINEIFALIILIIVLLAVNSVLILCGRQLKKNQRRMISSLKVGDAFVESTPKENPFFGRPRYVITELRKNHAGELWVRVEILNTYYKVELSAVDFVRQYKRISKQRL